MHKENIFDKLFKKKKDEEIIDLSLLNLKEESKPTTLQVKKDDEAIISNEDTLETKDFFDLSTIFAKQKQAHASIEPISCEYYKCKIFSRVSLDKLDYLSLEEELDKSFNYLTTKLKSIDEEFSTINFQNYEALHALDKRIDNLIFEQTIYKKRFVELNDNYCGSLKMSTVSVCLKMNAKELKEFYNSLNEYLEKKHDLTNAALEIYYHSGDFINDLINEFIYCIKLTHNKELIDKYTFIYFVSSDTVITLDYKEWVDLYNKLKFAYKYISDIEIDHYLSYKNKFRQFEIMYVILMMENEKKRVK